MRYRPEIDGLRAVAVLPVILFHAGIDLFSGGYVGVDIFFVISGYLITNLILIDLKHKKFSLSEFYLRRVRRILPALVLVILASLSVAWLFLLPSNLVDFSKSILYSLGFSSNFYFYITGTQYGAEDSLLLPFLHTWSLSIEEQYYIIFPLILLFVFKYLKKYLIYILLMGFILSLSVAHWASFNYPYINFYFLPTRGWELLAGSILAYLEIKNKYYSGNKLINNIFSILGFFLILHSILYFDDKMFHPSIFTLSPVLGVCLIICFANKNSIVNKILSLKVFVATGLISYSLYLWHYPIFAFGRLKYDEIILIDKFWLILLTLFLSIASYLFIEKPFRNKNLISVKTMLISLLSATLIIVLVNMFILSSNGFKKNFPKILQIDKIEEKTNLKNFHIYESKEKRKKIILVGDSHMQTLSYGLKNILISKGYDYAQSLKVGCQFILNLNRVNKKTLKTNNCNTVFQKKRLDFLNSSKNSIIILGGRLQPLLSEDKFDNKEGGRVGKMRDFLQPENNYLKTLEERNIEIFKEYKNTVNELLKNNHKIILVYPVPPVGWKVPNKIFKEIPKPFDKKKIDTYLSNLSITTSYKVFQNRMKKSFQLLDSINSPNVYRVYPHKLFCDNKIENRCVTHDDKNIFYSDDDHPSTKGASMINDLILKKVSEINF